MRLNLSGAVLVLAVGAGLARADDVVIRVPASTNMWLAGMPDGTYSYPDDAAPWQSPVLAEVGPISAGTMLMFSATGMTNFGIPDGFCGPEGGCWRDLCHLVGVENGMSHYCGGLSSLLGVFLGDERPDLSPAPEQQDRALRDLPEVRPQLKQVFHIGDGMGSAGSPQQFYAPAGATRLFLGTMDEYGWSNNTGELIVTVSSCMRLPGPVSDQVVCPSGEARFAAYAGGPGAEFRWEMEGAAGEWTAVVDGAGAEGYVFAGAATGLLSVRPATAFDAGHARRFRCVIGGGCLPEPVVAGPARLVVCSADVNCDGFLDLYDYGDFVACFEGSCPAGVSADFNGDGFVDFADYTEFVAAFEAGA